MKFEEVLRNSRRLAPEGAAVARWRQAVFAPESARGAAAVPGWLPSLASGVAMASMLLALWPAAARGPVGLKAFGVACDGRWAQSAPLRADVRGWAQPMPRLAAIAPPDQCGLCHLR